MQIFVIALLYLLGYRLSMNVSWTVTEMTFSK